MKKLVMRFLSWIIIGIFLSNSTSVQVIADTVSQNDIVIGEIKNNTLDNYVEESETDEGVYTETGQKLTYISDASYSVDEKMIILTPNKKTKAGAVYLSDKQSFLNYSTLEFEFKMGGNKAGSWQGDGADGICVNYSSSIPTKINPVGGTIGFSGKLGVEYDTWVNSGIGDPEGDHIGIHQDTYREHKAVYTVELDDLKWHSTKIQIIGDKMIIYLDGKKVIEKSGLNGLAEGYVGIVGMCSPYYCNAHYIRNISWKSGNINTSEKELIEKVSLYTSDGGKSYLLQLNKIIEHMKENNYTQEQRLHTLHSFHVHQGFSDPQEGISYCQDSINARKAYDYLVESECFTAYQYWYWLNFDDEGKAARGVLWADKFIFDNQIDQYFEPSTYITGETDSIKGYKELLLKFMSYDEPRYEMLSLGKKLKTAMEGAVDTTTDTYLQHYLKKMDECTSTEAMEEVFADYMKQIEPEIDKEGGKIVFNLKGCKEINKLIDVSGELLTVGTDVTDDIVNLMLLESKLETLNHYDMFLQDIIDGKDVLPRDMVIAAYQLKNETFQPYVQQLKTILGQLADHYVDDIYDLKSFFKKKIGDNIPINNPQLAKMKGVPLGDAIATIKLGAFCVDHLLGVNKLLDNSRDVEAYAYLGMYYSTLLIERKEAFLKNKTVSNAWKFYDTYQLLFDIRGQGEKAYYEMNQMDGIVGTLIKYKGWNFFRVNDKKAHLEETLDYLNNYCAFNLENAAAIGNDHFYVRKLVVSCPVDVQILDKNGALLYEIKDGEEGTKEVEFGKLVCKYIPKTADYEKVIYFTEEPDCIIKVVGVGEGVVDIKTAAKTGDEVIMSQAEQISIEKGGVITVDIENAGCQVDEDGDGKKEQDIPMVEMSDEFVPVESFTLSESEAELLVGEKKKLKAVLVPENATLSTVYWESNNEEVLEVSGGKLTARKPGEAIVSAYCGEFVAECKVTVVQPVTSISISKESLQMKEGETFVLNCEIMPNDASDKNVTWKSLNSSVATVDKTGKVTAVKAGTTQIVVSSNYDKNINAKATIIVTKKPVKVSKIKITGISKKIAAGKTIRLKAKITPKNADNKFVKWKSSNTKYATVSSDGKVKIKKAGAGKYVKITATAKDGSGVKAVYKIKIMKHQVKKIKLEVSNKKVKAGKTVKVKATVLTTGKKANKKLKWKSSNKAYATVTSKGTVKTKKAGKGKTVVITATATDGSGKKAKIRIKIK